MTEKIDRPNHIYKYFSLSSEEHWGRFADIIEKSRIFLSSPVDFNDPFDCMPCVVSPKSSLKWDIVGRRYAARIEREFGAGDAKKVRAGLKKLTDMEKRLLLEKASQVSAEETGVYCLTEVPDSVLMWSHYADNHRGICLRFDISKPPFSNLHAAINVVYKSERPKIPILRTNDDDQEIFNALRVKADFWDYEKEWRILMAGDAHKFMKIPDRMIDGLIFGARFNLSNKDRLMGLLNATGRAFDLYEMAVSPEAFRLSMQRVTAK